MNSIGIIGLGTLGKALAWGWRRARPDLQIFSTTRGSSNTELVSRTQTVFVCVKPQQAADVLHEIASVLTAEHRVISTCTGVSLEALTAALPSTRLIARAMPNIACEFNEGMTAIAFAQTFPPDSRDAIVQLFALLGDALTLEEKHFDAVTALSGCGPAYVCVIAEALGDAGVKAGLPRDVARRMAVQTLLGSTVLLRSVGEHPAVIRDRVTTPGGCTIDALTQLEEGGLRATLIAAVMTAAVKSATLSGIYGASDQAPTFHQAPSMETLSPRR